MNDIVNEIGSRAKNIEAEEVIIKTRDGDLIIRNPEIAVSRILGRDVYQIVGDVSRGVERERTREVVRTPVETKDSKQNSEIEDDLERILKGLRETVKDAEERK